MIDSDRNDKGKRLVCWASALGNCSEKQSKEHYATKGIFSNEKIFVKGQRWLDGETRLISKRTLGLRILCTTHNNALQPLDNVAIDFSRFCSEQHSLAEDRTKLPRSSVWKKLETRIDGFALERWLAKYAIGNLFEEKEALWYPDRSPVSLPPRDIVKAIFRKTPLREYRGLYLLGMTGESPKSKIHLFAQPMYENGTGLYIGSQIKLLNAHFLIWFAQDLDPKTVNFTTEFGVNFGPDPGEHMPKFHPTELRFIAKGKISGKIVITWK